MIPTKKQNVELNIRNVTLNPAKILEIPQKYQVDVTVFKKLFEKHSIITYKERDYILSEIRMISMINAEDAQYLETIYKNWLAETLLTS